MRSFTPVFVEDEGEDEEEGEEEGSGKLISLRRRLISISWRERFSIWNLRVSSWISWVVFKGLGGWVAVGASGGWVQSWPALKIRTPIRHRAARR